MAWPSAGRNWTKTSGWMTRFAGVFRSRKYWQPDRRPRCVPALLLIVGVLGWHSIMLMRLLTGWNERHENQQSHRGHQPGEAAREENRADAEGSAGPLQD